MRIFIAGLDGYLGWPLCLHLAMRGHALAGCDNFLRRRLVDEMGGQSAIPVFPIDERLRALQRHTDIDVEFRQGDVCDTSFIQTFLVDFQPEAIVHPAENDKLYLSWQGSPEPIVGALKKRLGGTPMIQSVKEVSSAGAGYRKSFHLPKIKEWSNSMQWGFLFVAVLSFILGGIMLGGKRWGYSNRKNRYRFQNH